jgi:hypothetical protein
MTIFFYVLVGVVAIALIRQILASGGKGAAGAKTRPRAKKKAGREVWIQVYDTDSLTEAHSLQARLEEEELDCLVYEQGRKDVHGNPLKGYGIAVPRTSVPRAQTIIVQTPS